MVCPPQFHYLTHPHRFTAPLAARNGATIPGVWFQDRINGGPVEWRVGGNPYNVLSRSTSQTIRKVIHLEPDLPGY